MPSPIFVSSDGFRVERIFMQLSLRRPPEALRVTWKGYFLGDCATVAEVAGFVELETLDAVED